MPFEEIRGAGIGGVGAVIEITVKLPPKDLILREIAAGFGATMWGLIKFMLTPKTGTGTGIEWYFHAGVSIPSPRTSHSSIVTWQGMKFVHGRHWDLKIEGINNHTTGDDLYVNGTMEVL